MKEVEIKRVAEDFARTHKKDIAQKLTDPVRYLPDDLPISAFMAGSPGAGKTEYSKHIIELLERNNEHKVIRVDADELRSYMPGYTGSNSRLFQTAISIIVDKIQDTALEQKQSFLLDGTLSKYDKAADNINRALGKGRLVLIFYVYQKPEVAWQFTQAREATEGRNIPKEVFIEQFIESRNTVNRIRETFDKGVLIFLVTKNFITHVVEHVIEITKDGQQIDDCLEQRYTKEELLKILC